MILAYAKGLLFGAGMSLMLGTVFFSLIHNSLHYGWRKGVWIAVGVVLSDVLFISLAVLGVSFFEAGNENIWIRLLAAVVLIVLAVNMLRSRQPKSVERAGGFGKALYFLSNGFLLNILNPVNFLFWAGLATTARVDWGYETSELLVFFSGCVTSIFISEVLISFGANKIQPFVSSGKLVWINRITAFLFILLALRFLYEALRYFLGLM